MDRAKRRIFSSLSRRLSGESFLAGGKSGDDARLTNEAVRREIGVLRTPVPSLNINR
jgi:hypothetical protein